MTRSQEVTTVVVGHVDHDQSGTRPQVDVEAALRAEVASLRADVSEANGRWYTSNIAITDFEINIERAEALAKKWHAQAVVTAGSQFASGCAFALQACAEELTKTLRGGK